MEDSFKLLEERVKKAVARLRELRSENEVLRGALTAAAARAGEAEQKLRAAGERTSGEAEAAVRLEAAEREAGDLRERQEKLRERMVVLLESLEKLE